MGESRFGSTDHSGSDQRARAAKDSQTKGVLADPDLFHEANVDPGSDIEPDIEFSSFRYSMDDLSLSVWGAQFDLLGSRDKLLELMRVISNQGHGTARKELTALSQELESLIRAALSAQLVLTGFLETERVAASPLGNTYGWDEESPHPQYRRLSDFLVDTLRIPRQEANRRIKLARDITRTTVVGQEHPAPQEGLREAILSGEVSIESAGHIARAIKDIKTLRPSVPEIADLDVKTPDDEFDAQTPVDDAPLRDRREFWAEHAEEYLCEHASSIDPDELKRLAKRWVLHVDPDGQEPNERYLAQKQGAFYLGCENNLHSYLLRMTSAQQEHFLTRTAGIADRSDVQVGAGIDMPFADETMRSAMGVQPTRAQKTLEAIMAALEHVDQSFSETGPHTTVLATIDHERLFGQLVRAAWAEAHTVDAEGPTLDSVNSEAADPNSTCSTSPLPKTANGGASGGTEIFAESGNPRGPLARIATLQHTGPISASEVRRLACEARIVPIVLGGASEPLDVGRGSRLFTRAQRLALAARDKGCIFPGCTAPVFRCEAHHVNHWKAHGGETNVGNGALLCPYHHHVIHKGTWTLRIIDGKPWVIPPPWVDRTRRPRRNFFYTLDELGPVPSSA